MTNPTTPATPARILSCPSWCRPEGEHAEFAWHVAGEHAGAHVRCHDRKLGRFSAGYHSEISAWLMTDDVIRCDDQGVAVERTPAYVSLIVEDARYRAAVLEVPVDDLHRLVDVLTTAAAHAEQVTR